MQSEHAGEDVHRDVTAPRHCESDPCRRLQRTAYMPREAARIRTAAPSAGAIMAASPPGLQHHSILPPLASTPSIHQAVHRPRVSIRTPAPDLGKTGIIVNQHSRRAGQKEYTVHKRHLSDERREGGADHQ